MERDVVHGSPVRKSKFLCQELVTSRYSVFTNLEVVARSPQFVKVMVVGPISWVFPVGMKTCLLKQLNKISTSPEILWQMCILYMNLLSFF